MTEPQVTDLAEAIALAQGAKMKTPQYQGWPPSRRRLRRLRDVCRWIGRLTLARISKPREKA